MKRKKRRKSWKKTLRDQDLLEEGRERPGRRLDGPIGRPEPRTIGSGV